MICIMLHIQTDEGLGDTIDDGQTKGGCSRYPFVLQVKEKANVKERTGEPSWSSEITTWFTDLEHLTLDFFLEFTTPSVSRGERDREKRG